MTPEARTRLRNLLIHHEGYRQFPYTDTTGHLTIAIGRNLTDRGISVNEALTLLEDDITFFTNKLRAVIPLFDRLNDARQIVLVNMCFNLGVNGLLRFKSMLKALENKDYEEAAKQMLNSKWAEQVGQRAHDLSTIMKDGELS